jgi:hypothetical protein
MTGRRDKPGNDFAAPRDRNRFTGFGTIEQRL